MGRRVRDVTLTTTTDEAYGAGGTLLWRNTGGGMVHGGRNGGRNGGEEWCQEPFYSEEWCQEEWCQEPFYSGKNLFSRNKR